MSIDVDFIRLLWQQKMFEAADLQFFPQGEFQIDDFGVAVDGATSDFSGVVVRDLSTGAVAVGGVRIDCRSSDWRAEGEVGNPKYDNIILHVVVDRDAQLLRGGRVVPTCVIHPAPQLVDYFERMRVDCDGALDLMSDVDRAAIITRLLDERIERKAAEVRAIIEQMKGSWHEAAYVCFMRALGSQSESKADFQSIAQSLPYSRILLHSERRELIEALMLGQAGHLDVENADYYIKELQREYIAARNENGMLPAVVHWKPVRRRPYSSQPLTLVRAAAILNERDNLFEDILTVDNLDLLRRLFIVDVSDYWRCHSAPMKGEGKVYGAFSKEKADLIIINFVIPMLLAHASLNGDDRLVERAISFYEALPSEPNIYSRRWTGRRWRPLKAYDSQALVQLGAEYCAKGRCGACPVGRHRLLAKWRQGV